MDFEFLVPLIFLFFIITLIMGMLAMVGVSPGMILYLLMNSRRHRTEMVPRDHFDRWAHGHRRSARENKPRHLKRLRTTGDRMVPETDIGKVQGIEPWLSFQLVFAKTRRWSWSDPFFIPQDMIGDLNRRTCWVRCRGFSRVGPIRIPIPIEGDTCQRAFKRGGKIVWRTVPRTVNSVINEVMDGFRFSGDQQLNFDVTEDGYWGVGTAMAPPIDKRTRVTEADSPGFSESEYLDETTATGGKPT